jgi:hypothetical protein
MKEVRVRTEQLKERITTNRDTHAREFAEAVDGWAKEVAQLMRADIAAIEAGERRKLTILDSIPDNHTADYDRVLEMLDMSVDEFQTLDMETFRQYVMDDWSWKARWSVSTAKYLSGPPV